jgi:thiamine-phosphate pyrophosphorylase
VSEARRKARFQLYLITDRHLAAPAGGLVTVVEAALAAAAEVAPPGAVAVQLREKDLEARDIYELACALRPRCTRFGAPLLINDRIDVAMAAGADGVHLPSNSFEIDDARALLGSMRWIGVSTHQGEEVAAAAAHGADFAVFGPVFDPLSKAAYGPARGLGALATAVEAAGTMPVYALGGITGDRIAGMVAVETGTRPAGIAVIGAIFGASEPDIAARDLMRALARLETY